MTASNPDSRRRACAYAEKAVAKMFNGSQLVDNSSSFPRFSKEEITKGKLLGKGAFGSVYEVLSFNSTLKTTKSSDDEEESGVESRQFIAKHCIRQGGDARYAVKVISEDVVKDLGKFIQAVQDVAIEIRCFSDLEHPNIIKLRALPTSETIDESSFIVMDRLCDTLEAKIKKWGKRQKGMGGFGKLMDRKGKKKAELMEERIVAAFDLSSAFEYLHQRNIIYRDLKPDNVGFDVRGDIKLFDFGLAKEIISQEPDNDGLYKLTEMTGSPRYMAPEVANGERYNKTCDVYSFALVLWQMISLKTPFELYTSKRMTANVWNGERKRPGVNAEIFNQSLAMLLKRSWTHDPRERNTMKTIVAGLRKEAVRLRDGEETGLEHNRRRSTFVMPRARRQSPGVVGHA